jgi:uncharacterized protein
MPAHRSLELSSAKIEPWLEGLPMREALGEDAGEAGEASVELDLYAENENVFARGKLTGWCELACSRCLEPTRVSLEDDIMVTYLPEGQVPNEDGSEIDEAEAEEDDQDVYPYEGEEVDLEPMLRERFLMSVPYAPLCTEDCAGLCSVCGANLNSGDCGCDRKVVDPRLAALKNIKV